MSSLMLGAINVSEIIGACVLVISVLSWFVNVIQGNTPDGKPRAQPQKQKPPSGRSEIEVLLQQLAGGKPKTGTTDEVKAPEIASGPAPGSNQIETNRIATGVVPNADKSSAFTPRFRNTSGIVKRWERCSNASHRESSRRFSRTRHLWGSPKRYSGRRPT